MNADLKKGQIIWLTSILIIIVASICILLSQPDVMKSDLFSIYLLLIIMLFALTAALVFSVMIWENRRTLLENEKNLNKAVTVDPMTGLLNKASFEAEARKILDSIPPERTCLIVYFEIVAFRSYNYLYGYESGNELIKSIADIVRDNNSEDGIAARLYADHFLVLMTGENLEEIFELLRKGVRQLKSTGKQVSLCGGIYIAINKSLPVPNMIDRAIVAQEAVKSKFGSGVAVYNDSMLSYQIEDAELLGTMLQTESTKEFVVYYQPKFSVSTENIVGAEALVRWVKPNGEIVLPGRFIGLFEKNGFIRKLDFQIFEKACEMLRDALAAGKPVVPVSVNFSRVHLYDFHFAERVRNIAEKYKVDAKYLEIELTESAFFMNSEDLIMVVDELHESGFSVSIDDFGSGFSSLNMLKDIDVDALKIDMKFLEGFEHGGKVGTVVTAVIRMAKWLGIHVVAEGVETKEQADFLRTLGCDMIQGFYYSKALSQSEYEELLSRKETDVRPFTAKPAGVTLEGINAALGGDSLITSLADAIFGGVGLYELDGKRLEAIRVNNAYLELMGYPNLAAFRAHSLNIFSQFPPADVEKVLKLCDEAVKTGKVQKSIFSRFDYHGKLRTFSGLMKHIGGTNERPMFCITFMDITEKARAEKERELNKYGAALASIYDEIWEYNQMTDTLCLLYAHNKRKPGKELKFGGASLSWLRSRIHPDDIDAVSKTMSLLREGMLELPHRQEYRIFDKGEVRWISSSMIPMAGGSFLLCNLDITDKKQVEQIVSKLGNVNRKLVFDEVSGVLSKESTEELVSERLETEASGRASALMVIRIDNYKAVEEKLGLDAANLLIKNVATKIKSKFRDYDIIGRIDEGRFAVYLSNIADFSTVEGKAKKLQSALNEIAAGEQKVFCSVGFGRVASDERDYYRALANAAETLIADDSQ